MQIRLAGIWLLLLKHLNRVITLILIFTMMSYLCGCKHALYAWGIQFLGNKPNIK